METAAGTAYTRFSTQVPGAGTVRWVVPDLIANESYIPVVLYAHGAGGDNNQFQALSAWAGLREWLIDNGWAWIEGTGGGLQPWGNSDSREAYEIAYQHVAGILDLGPVVILGRSMGGLVAQWLYTQSPVLEPVSIGAIINSGVQGLPAAYESGNWTTAMREAYGATTDAEFYANSVGCDPLVFDPELWAGKNVIQLVGDADTSVPPAEHAYPMRDVYAGQPSIDLLDVRAGGTHSATNGSYLQVDAMTDFLLQVQGAAPAPPVPAVIYKIRAQYLIDDNGQRRTLKDRA